MTDLFSKACHFAPFKSDYRPLDVARVLLAWVFRLYGQPKALVSDRDPAFTAEVWQELHRLLGTNLAMSTAYHPQSDGQTERAHRVLEEMLRAFVDEEHSNWDEMLPLCEFSYNNAKHSVTKHSPFRLLRGYDPPTPPAVLAEAALPRQANSPEATGFLVKMQRAWESAREAIKEAQESQKRQANRSRRPTAIKAGSKVKLETRFVLKSRVGGPKPKLNPQWIGPFTVLKMVGKNAAELELPEDWRMHPVVNVSRLEPYLESDRFHQEVLQPEAVPLPVPAEFPFRRVAGYLADKGRGRSKQYLVQWIDLPAPAFVDAALLEQQCRDAYGDDRVHRELIDKLKKLQQL